MTRGDHHCKVARCGRTAVHVVNMLDDGQGSCLVLIGNRARFIVSARDRTGAISRIGSGVAGDRILGDGVATDSSDGLGGRCARPGVAAGGGDSAEGSRERAWRRGSTVAVDYLFDDRQGWRSVVVGDGACRVSAVRHRAGAPCAQALTVVTRAAGLIDTVTAGVDRKLNANFRAGEIVVAGMTRANGHCKGACCGRTAIRVVNMLDNGKGSRLVLIGNRAGLRLSDRDGAVAIGRIGSYIACYRALSDAIATGCRQRIGG